MSFIALLENYAVAYPDGTNETYAWKTGFTSREEAWAWTISKVSELWPGSRVIEEVEGWHRRELRLSEEATRAIDFGVLDPTDPAHELQLAITISDEPFYQDPAAYTVPESQI